MSKRSADGQLITIPKNIEVNEECAARVTLTVLPDVALLRILSFLSRNESFQIRTVSYLML